MRKSGGFTLIEMTLVLLLIGLVVALVIPNLVMVGSLSAASRQLSGLARTAAVSAVTQKQIHRITFNTSDNSCWVSVMKHNQEIASNDPDITGLYSLPTGISYQDVRALGHGRNSSGRPYVQFYPSGRADGAIIDITDGTDAVTLDINPITAHVRVRDSVRESTRISALPDKLQGLFVPRLGARRSPMFLDGGKNNE